MRRTKQKNKNKDRPEVATPGGVAPITESEVVGDLPTAPEAEPPLIEIELSDEAADLIRQLEEERDGAVEARQRALADYRNFQRRATENELRATHDGASQVVRSVLPVLDHFDLALDQDETQLNVEQLFDGVKMVRAELMKALEAHGVSRIEPEIGGEFDPNRHEAMTRMPAEGVEPNHIVVVLQPGYALGAHVLRPAKVAIAPDHE